MVRLIVSKDELHSFLVSSESERELRQFLRDHQIRPRRAGFGFIVPPPCIRLSCYHLAGDEHLKIRALKIPRITFGNLALYVIQALPVKRPRYGTLPRSG